MDKYLSREISQRDQDPELPSEEQLFLYGPDEVDLIDKIHVQDPENKIVDDIGNAINNSATGKLIANTLTHILVQHPIEDDRDSLFSLLRTIITMEKGSSVPENTTQMWHTLHKLPTVQHEWNQI